MYKAVTQHNAGLQHHPHDQRTIQAMDRQQHTYHYGFPRAHINIVITSLVATCLAWLSDLM